MQGAFLLTPPTMTPSPDHREARAVIAAYGQALAAAPPPRLVALSSVGAEQARGVGNVTASHLMEEALGDLPIPVAFVRPRSFYENFVPALDHIAATGVFDSFVQPVDRAVPMAATADIGTEVARLLVGGWHGRTVVELGTRTSTAQLAAMGLPPDRTVSKAPPRPSRSTPPAADAASRSADDARHDTATTGSRGAIHGGCSPLLA